MGTPAAYRSVVMVGKKRKSRVEVDEAPLDLASRIGMPGSPEPVPAPQEPVRRVDGPIESSRGRPILIGANEPLPPPLAPRNPIMPVAGSGRPAFIGLEELPVQAVETPASPVPAPEAQVMEYAPIAATVREAPLAGEMDLVVTPLPTPDDWHHFELALRRVPGVGTLRTEYYRAGILKLRVQWSGADRFASAIAKVPGYRVGILGEDRTTVQIRVGRA